MPSSFTSGCNVLIQGSSRGIGLEFVRQLLGDAAPGRIFAACRAPQAASSLVELAAQDPRLRLVELDVTSDTSIRAAAATVAAEVPRLHLIVNCAGLLHDRADRHRCRKSGSPTYEPMRSRQASPSTQPARCL